MCFSCVKMSSRRLNSVLPSCGTNAIGASFRIFASAGRDRPEARDRSMSKCGAFDMKCSHRPVAAVHHHDLPET